MPHRRAAPATARDRGACASSPAREPRGRRQRPKARPCCRAAAPRWLQHLSSSVSSIVMSRSAGSMAASIDFDRVVLPEPVRPQSSIFRRARTAAAERLRGRRRRRVPAVPPCRGWRAGCASDSSPRRGSGRRSSASGETPPCPRACGSSARSFRAAPPAADRLQPLAIGQFGRAKGRQRADILLAQRAGQDRDLFECLVVERDRMRSHAPRCRIQASPGRLIAMSSVAGSSSHGSSGDSRYAAAAPPGYQSASRRGCLAAWPASTLPPRFCYCRLRYGRPQVVDRREIKIARDKDR